MNCNTWDAGDWLMPANYCPDGEHFNGLPSPIEIALTGLVDAPRIPGWHADGGENGEFSKEGQHKRTTADRVVDSYLVVIALFKFSKTFSEYQSHITTTPPRDAMVYFPPKKKVYYHLAGICRQI